MQKIVVSIKSFFFILMLLTRDATCQPIFNADTLLIGGIKQYVTMQGADSTKPLLLFLHGGPGNSVMSYADRFTNKLQDNFVVIHWDQRETGRTLMLNKSPVPLSLDLFKNDTYELIRVLLEQSRHPKLYLVAHSWGTVLGSHIAQHYPELLYAFISIGAVINQSESERLALQKMLTKANQAKDTLQLKELATVQVPFQNADQLYYHRKWLFHFNGQQSAFRKITKSYIASWASTWLEVWNEASEQNLAQTLTSINCPVYFFAGRKDIQTNSGLVEAYYKKISAPKKGLFWFERSGHAVPTTEPQLMQQVIIEKILPETF